METLKRYNVHCMGADPADDDIELNEAGRWMEATDVLAALAKRDLDEQEASETHEATAENLRVLQGERGALEDKIDNLILENRLQTRIAEDMVTLNASLIASRNGQSLVVRELRASLEQWRRRSGRTQDDLNHRIDERNEAHRRVGHLTGRLMDAAVLLNRMLTKPSFETVQHVREFIAIIKADTEGYTLTGPCDIPLLYAKIDLLKEDGTPMDPGDAALPAPEPGVKVNPQSLELLRRESESAYEWHTSDREQPRPPLPTLLDLYPTRPATDGTPVVVHPDFAKSYDAAPGLWQSTIDSVAADAKRLGINPAQLDDEAKRRMMQAVVDAPEAPPPEESLFPSLSGHASPGPEDMEPGSPAVLPDPYEGKPYQRPADDEDIAF